MPDKFAHARGWFLKAESDLATCKSMLAGRGPYDTACFHAQQAVEKYLKSLLALAEQPIARTHRLEELQQMVCACNRAWSLADMALVELTPYAVELRYDFEFWPDRKTAEEALDVAQQVRQRVLAFIPPEARP